MRMMICKKSNQIPTLAGDTQRPPGEIESAVQPSETRRHQLRKEQICRENRRHLVNAGGHDNDNGKQHRQGGGQRANNNSGNFS